MPKPKRTAKKSDKHVLYELSVQEPEADIDFAEGVYKRLRGAKPKVLREDFCGTAVLACEWVKRRKGNRALGVDLDGHVLEWGRRHHVSKLGSKAASRLQLVEANVLDVTKPKADLTLAMNFSYWVFKTRPELLEYFRSVHRALKADGVFVLDLFGGTESQILIEEKTEYTDEGFTYVWDQDGYNPITNEILCRIHFEFPNGSKMRNAFTYDWRLWTPVEVCEALHDAGFAATKVYWEGDGDDGEGDGIFRPRKRAETCEGWIAYVVAAK